MKKLLLIRIVLLILLIALSVQILIKTNPNAVGKFFIYFFFILLVRKIFTWGEEQE